MTSTCRACALLLLLPSPALAGDFERGVEALRAKDYVLAIAWFNAHIRDNPQSAAAYHNRGLAYAEKKEYDKAVADFTEAVRLNPKNADAYVNRGYAYARKKDHDKAIRDYTEAVRLDPRMVNAYYNRGLGYSQRREYDQAIRDYAEAVRLDPGDASGHEALAWLLATCPQDGPWDGRRAVGHATRACELSKWKEANCLDTLAAAHAECGDFGEAVKWQQKAMELGFGDKDAEKKGRQRLKRYERGRPYRDE